MRSDFFVPMTSDKRYPFHPYQLNDSASLLIKSLLINRRCSHYSRLRSLASVHRVRHCSKPTSAKKALSTSQNLEQDADEPSDTEGNSS